MCACGNMNLLLETTYQIAGANVYFREFAPCRALHAHVACFWSFDKRASQLTHYEHRVLPDGCTDIIFDLCVDSPNAVVIGPMIRPRTVISDTKPALGVRFFPGAALTFLDFSLASLQERVVPLSEFHAADSDRLLNQLLATDGLARQIAIVEDWLLARLRRPPLIDPHIMRAIKWTYAERGRLQVSELAKAVGLCERQLNRKFPVWTGYTPKQFVRVMRFQHALESMTHTPAIRDADVAAMHGYADQSHMIREFCELGGGSPRTFQRSPWITREKCPIFSIPAPGTLRYHREP